MDLTRTHPRAQLAVIACEGRLNMVAAPKLKACIEETIEQGSPHIVIDLSSTSFIDSSGLGALIGGLKRARQSSGDLRIAAASEQVRAVLRLTNLDRVLRPYEKVDDASQGW